MALVRLAPGDEIIFGCWCGRDCPMRWDVALDTIVIDHGGEAVYIMPHEQWAALDDSETMTLRQTTLAAWLDRVHEYERVG